MKKVLLFLTIAINCFAYDADVFKDGFEAGLRALQFQIKNDGAIPQKIDLKKQFVVILPTDSIAMNEIVYIQYIAHKEDFKTSLTKDGLIFGDYDRKIDASEAVDRIKRILNYEAQIITNDKEFFTYPFLAKPVYDLISDGLVRDGAIKEVRIIYVNATKETKSSSAKVAKTVKNQVKTKNIVLKNSKAQSYQLIGDSKRSSNYLEGPIVDKRTFKTANTFTTSSGEVFVKVLNENLYFLKSDVEFQ